MIVEIPGRASLRIDCLVFDYNGTLAVDGIISDKIKSMITELAESYKIYILTADTFGSAAVQCENLPVILKTSPEREADAFKEEIVESLNPSFCACLGNGFNDIKMFKKAAFSVGVMEKEGVCAELINHSDIIVSSIEDGLNLFLNTKKIIAGLRS